MYARWILILALIVPGSVSAQGPAPDWARRTFPAASDRVFAAALKSIAAQGYEVEVKNEGIKMVSFNVGATAWSWGYNMVLKVSPAENNTSNVSIEVARRSYRGRASLVGSGKKEVQKIFQGIERELAKATDHGVETK